MGTRRDQEATIVLAFIRSGHPYLAFAAVALKVCGRMLFGMSLVWSVAWHIGQPVGSLRDPVVRLVPLAPLKTAPPAPPETR